MVLVTISTHAPQAWSPDGRSLVYGDCHPEDDPGHAQPRAVAPSPRQAADYCITN
jgi:hypothetical protein